MARLKNGHPQFESVAIVTILPPLDLIAMVKIVRCTSPLYMVKYMSVALERYKRHFKYFSIGSMLLAE